MMPVDGQAYGDTAPGVSRDRDRDRGPVCFPVPVWSLAPEVFHEGLGDRAEVDVHSSASAAALQR